MSSMAATTITVPNPPAALHRQDNNFTQGYARSFLNSMDKVEAPIITCNDSMPTRIRRPSTPSSRTPNKPGVPVASFRKGRDEKKQGARIRSVSAGRDHKTEMCSRYWSYLFENLERSISEIYDGCEKEENIRQCKEVVLILENYTRDFKNLIEWFNLKWSYEKTPAPMRPTALAWEIRKPSICLLPHTRAYEKLLGLKEGSKSVDEQQPSAKPNTVIPLTNIGQLNPHSVVLKTDPKLKNNPNPVECEMKEGKESALSHGSPNPFDSNPLPEFTNSANLTQPERNIPGPCSKKVNNRVATAALVAVAPRSIGVKENTVPEKVSIGLQTDLVEDPDIYYIAGGRNIANQTDASEEYPPLELITFNSTIPITIVFLNSTDSDIESSFVINETLTIADSTNNNTYKKLPLSDNSSSEPWPVPLRVESPCDPSIAKINCVTGADLSVCESNNQLVVPNSLNNIRPCTPIETKSSATQLSAGDVLIDEKVEGDAPKGGGGDVQMSISVPTSSGDRQGQQMGNLNLKPKVPPIPNYRSNIASRCRTAVNTGYYGPGILPCKSVNPNTGVGKGQNPKVNTGKKFTIGGSSSTVNKPHAPNNGNNNTGGSARNLHAHSYGSLPDEIARGGRKRSHTIDEDGWETVKARSSRSKWSSSNSSLASSNANQSRNSLDKGKPLGLNHPQQKPLTPKPKNTLNNIANSAKISDNNKKVGGNIPAKEVVGSSAATKGRNEKVAASVPVSTAAVPLAQPKVKNTHNISTSAVSGTSSAKKDACEDEITVDEEEIKKKEADLDNAIREEELLEEELLQVEKDFERIEKDRTDDDRTTDSEHAISPETILSDLEIENFFFVSMDDQEAAKVEEFPPRETGRILSLREKLMSPAKKADGAVTLKRYKEKLAKAERNREKLLQSKFNRYVELSDRFETLNETTKKLVAERAELILKAEERRKRAEEKRIEYLKSIKRKAHDEDSKAKEIAFINLLEAQNKRHDYFASAQEVQDRLQTIQEERRVRLEERAGKASAVIRRQSHIRKNWQVKLEEIQEKRRKIVERITREKEERAKERSEMAQEKARDREERISALNAAKQAEKEELQKKIKQKQEDTARRHEENMEHIRQKAMELSAPRIQEENTAPTSVRMCTLCKVVVQSEVQELAHLRGRAHLDSVKKMESVSVSNGFTNLLESFGLKFITDVPVDKIDCKLQPDKSRQKAAKKHIKKSMQKLMEKGEEFEKLEKETRCEKQWGDPSLKSKIRKSILEAERLVGLFDTNKGSPTLAITLDRILTEIRKACVKHDFLKESIIGLNGISLTQKLLKCSAADLPSKLKIAACDLLQGFLLGNLTNSMYLLRGTAVCSVINLCASEWNTLIPDDNRWLCASPIGSSEPLPSNPLIEAVVALLLNLLECVPDPFNGVTKKGSPFQACDIEAIKGRTHDIIGHLVASGVVDRISVYCAGVRGPVDDQPEVARLLQVFMDFLVVLIYALQFCWGADATGCIMSKKEPDGTQLLAALEASELAGGISMAYSILLHQGAPNRPRTAESETAVEPPCPGEKSAGVIKSTLCLVNALARLDLIALQNVLGSEAVSLQFRHIASQLLWQIVPHREDYKIRRLLTELIIAIGNFTVGNKINQVTIQSGQTPTVLQLLCSLPQEYFTDAKYFHNLFPTLVAATHGCPENREILLQNNVDVTTLDSYINSEGGKRNVIIRRLLQVTRKSSADFYGILTPTSNNKGSGDQKSTKTEVCIEKKPEDKIKAEVKAL